MRYLVTGARGFAGRHLVYHLRKLGHGVIAWDREDCDLLKIRRTKDKIASLKPEGIFHLAAPQTSVGQSWKDRIGTITDNRQATLSVLVAASSLNPKPKVFFTSSAEVLGNAGSEPLAETTPTHPLNPYALSKVEGEELCRHYWKNFGVPVVIVRAFNHIGPGQRKDFVFPNFARQIARIEEGSGVGEILVSNLAARRDFTDARDMVVAYSTLMERGIPGEIYHAGSGKSWSIREILEILLDLSPAQIKIVVDPDRFRPNDIPEQKCDPAKIKALGWKPKIPLTQTLTDILEDARDKVKQDS